MARTLDYTKGSELLESGVSPDAESPPGSGSDSEVDCEDVTYKLEGNVYGFIVQKKCSAMAACLLAFFYAIVSGATAVISVGVYSTYITGAQDVFSLCNDDSSSASGSHDCRPTAYAALADWDSLDTDGDGTWTVDEARDAGILLLFRSLNEVAVTNELFLEVVYPPVPADETRFCPYAEPPATLFDGLTDAETIAMANVSGWIKSHKVSEECGTTYTKECLLAACIIDEDDSRKPLAVTSPSSQYVQSTNALNLIDRQLYDHLFSNLIRPCRLVHGDLCANAEMAGWLSEVPMWESDDSQDRNDACSAYVQETCPMIFGNDYRKYQLTSSSTCGEPSYGASDVPIFSGAVPAAKENCDNDQGALSEMVQAVIHLDPMIEYVLMGYVQSNYHVAGDPAQTLMCHMDMFCFADDIQVKSPDGDGMMTNFQTIFGEACPQTCCPLEAGPGCPAECVQASAPGVQSRQMDYGEVLCLSCENVGMATPSPGSLLVTYNGCPASEWYDTARLIFNATRPLFVQILSLMSLGEPDDEDCEHGYLSIDGTKHCKESGPTGVSVYISNSEGRMVTMAYEDYDCTSTKFKLIVSDSGNSAYYSVSPVDYASVKLYFESMGLLSYSYEAFFVVIAFVWSLQTFKEVRDAINFFRFVCTAPHNLSEGTRVALIAFACIPRVLILVWVFCVGCILFVVEHGYVNLVLNALALGFLIDLDEVLYAVALPVGVRNQVSENLEVKWSREAGPCARLEDSQLLRAALPAVPAVIFVVAQYRYLTYSWSETAARLQCACSLTGTTCVDAVL